MRTYDMNCMRLDCGRFLSTRTITEIVGNPLYCSVYCECMASIENGTHLYISSNLIWLTKSLPPFTTDDIKRLHKLYHP